MNASEEVKSILKLWSSLLNLPCPSEAQINCWRSGHSFATITHAIRKTAWKAQNLSEPMSFDHAVRFASAVMNGKSKLLRKQFDSQLKELSSLAGVRV